jgi:hypothetical protein
MDGNARVREQRGAKMCSRGERDQLTGVKEEREICEGHERDVKGNTLVRGRV